MSRPARASPLSRYMLLAYALLIVYASLHPFSGWSAQGAAPFAFLFAPAPRHMSAFDLIANLLGYAPFGFLAVLALHPRLQRAAALAAASCLALALSLTMEALQTFLTSRIPSNLDFAANTSGGIAGALIAVAFAKPLLREDGLPALRYKLFRAGGNVDLGLVLLGLWLLSQLNPGTLLFGNGDLRALFYEPTGILHPAGLFIRVEAFVSAANSMAVGLLIALLAGPGQPVRVILVLAIATALAVRTLAYGVLFTSQDLLAWMTPGASIGIAAGTLVVIAAVALPRRAQLVLCGLAIMAATVVVNLAPENPYLAASLSTWRQGHFLNFNGFTRVLSEAWPFLALVYVLALAAARERFRD